MEIVLILLLLSLKIIINNIIIYLTNLQKV